MNMDANDKTAQRETNSIKRRPRRTKSDIDILINKAAERLVKEKGFTKVMVTEIMAEAGVEPAVFYKRYKKLDDFYVEFVKNYDYWFGEIIKKSMSGDDMMDDVYNMLESLLEYLCDKSIMLEVLRWEIAESNDITMRTSLLREEHTLPLAGRYLSHYFGTDVDIVAWVSLMIGGIYYMCLHKDRAEFCGIDINNPKHVERLKRTLRVMVDQLRWLVDKKTEKLRIAEKLRKCGVDNEIIKKCME